MVYTRTVELSPLGASWHPAMNNATSLEHVLAMVNTSNVELDPFPNIPSSVDQYTAYEKDSVCFVEPMVRVLKPAWAS